MSTLLLREMQFITKWWFISHASFQFVYCNIVQILLNWSSQAEVAKLIKFIQWKECRVFSFIPLFFIVGFTRWKLQGRLDHKLLPPGGWFSSCNLSNKMAEKKWRILTFFPLGLSFDGLYRVCGNVSTVQKLRIMVDQGECFPKPKVW